MSKEVKADWFVDYKEDGEICSAIVKNVSEEEIADYMLKTYGVKEKDITNKALLI